MRIWFKTPKSQGMAMALGQIEGALVVLVIFGIIELCKWAFF